MKNAPLDSAYLDQFKVRVFEPFSDFLHGSAGEKSFELSLLDVVRFAGHACPSMVGAFLIAKTAIAELYPEDETCIRGDIRIDLPGGPTQGAIGPIANVFGFITGAWGETGFGGLNGQFKRRNLTQFASPQAPAGGFRFTRISSGEVVEVFYDPSKAKVEIDPSQSFQEQWRVRIRAILENPEKCLRVQHIDTALSPTAER